MRYIRPLDISVFRGHVLPFDRRTIHKTIGFANFVKDLPEGVFVECGVGKARTFAILAALAGPRPLHGFDSFEGFPEPTEEDASSRNPQKGEWAYITKEDVFNILRTAGLPTDNVTLHEGFLENTVPNFVPQPIALLHVDVDLYESYKDTLKLSRFVVPGGRILFDEYNTEAWPGATKAVNEWLVGHDKQLQYSTELDRYYVIM